MQIRDISVKQAVLIPIALVVTLAFLTLYLSTELLSSYVEQNQLAAISTQVESVSAEIQEKTLEHAKAMASSFAKEKSLKTSLKAALKGDTSKLDTYVESVDKQIYVTGGLVDFKYINIYDTDFKNLAQYGENPRTEPVPTLFNRLKSREGKDRFTTEHYFYTNPQTQAPRLSVVMALGGLRLKGYMELVFNPATNLKALESKLQRPIKVESLAGNADFTSENWGAQAKTGAEVEATIEANGYTYAKIKVLSDISGLVHEVNSIRLWSFSALGLISLVLMISVFSALETWLFTSVRHINDALARLAQLDFTSFSSVKAVKETSEMQDKLGSLVKTLADNTRDIHQGCEVLNSNVLKSYNSVDSNRRAVAEQHQEMITVASAVEELSASINEVAQSAENTNAIVTKCSKSNQDSAASMTEMANVTSSFIQMVSDSSEQVKDLLSRVGGISKFLEIIEGIAEQTNLLALNAAIEAARAGEAGRGFAVVADEVRGLAGKTHSSTEQIRDMINQINKQINRVEQTSAKSIEQSQSTQTFLTELENSVALASGAIQEMNTQVTEIAHTTEEQASVTREVASSVARVSSGFAHLVHAADESAQISKDVEDVSSNLIHLVNTYRF